jgi:hypothetical protein
LRKPAPKPIKPPSFFGKEVGIDLIHRCARCFFLGLFFSSHEDGWYAKRDIMSAFTSHSQYLGGATQFRYRQGSGPNSGRSGYLLPTANTSG